jgi:hypothetical protein
MKNDVIKVFGAFLLLFVVAIGSTFSMGSVTKKAQSNAVLDQKETKLSAKKSDIKWSPDGHISYITLPNDVRRYFLSGNQKAYMIESKSAMSLAEILKGNPTIKQVYGPDPNFPYKNNYATIAQVLQTDVSNPNHVFAFAQYEQQAVKPDKTFDYSNFTASIGLLESYDGGLSWKDFGPVIRGDDYLAPGTRISGAGEPSAIIKDGFVYVYFVNWSAKGIHKDQIYLARTKIYPNQGLGAFEFYTSGGFLNQEANLQPVISVPENGDYASLPSISYNKYLNQYFAIYEINTGFMSATSFDGLTWTNSKTVFTFPQAQSSRKIGDTWYSYPTFLSEAENSDQFTQKSGNLYYAQGIWPNVAHEPFSKTFEIM